MKGCKIIAVVFPFIFFAEHKDCITSFPTNRNCSSGMKRLSCCSAWQSGCCAAVPYCCCYDAVILLLHHSYAKLKMQLQFTIKQLQQSKRFPNKTLRCLTEKHKKIIHNIHSLHRHGWYKSITAFAKLEPRGRGASSPDKN